MTRDLKREQEEFRNWRAQRIYDYTDEEFKTRNKNHPELPTNCYLKGFDAYESSPKYKKMIETLKFYGNEASQDILFDRGEKSPRPAERDW